MTFDRNLRDGPGFGSLLPIECERCRTPLVRVTQSESNDKVVCPICWAIGDYDAVANQGADLVRGIVVEKEIRDLVNQIRFLRK